MKFVFILFVLFSFSIFAQNYSDLYKQSQEALLKRDFENAILLAEKAREDAKAKFGPGNKFESNIYGLLGKIYFYKGDYNKAIENYENEKTSIERIVGKDNANYAKVLNNLFVCYSSIGRGDELEGILKESIEIKKAIGGEKDTSYAKSLNNLAMFYYNKGKYPEAENLLVEALDVKKAKLSPNDPSTALTMLNLGMLYQGLGNKEKALKSLESAYQIMKVALDKSNPDRAKTAFQLASFYVSEGKKEQAEKILEENVLTSTNSEMSVDDANAIYNYAQLQVRLHKEDIADKALSSALPKVKAKLGMGHPLYSKMVNVLGIIKRMKGELDAAHQLFIENLEITRQLYGEKNIQFGSALHNLAGILQEQGFYDQADKTYSQAFDVYFYQIDNYFPYFSEAEKTNFYRMMKERFDMFNSYALSRQLENPKILTQMYDYQIKTKGLLLDYSKNVSAVVENSGNTSLISKYKEYVKRKVQLTEFYNKSLIELEKIGVDLEKFEEETNKIEREISLDLSKITNTKNSNVTWKDIQKYLKKDDAAVEVIRFNFYTKSRSDSVLYAILILNSETKDYPKLIVLDNASLLDDAYLTRYKKTVKAKFPDHKSYAAYWSEIDKELGDKKNIYFSGDGAYNLINISSLRLPDNSFVLENKTIIHLNNTKELLSKSTQTKEKNISVLIGAPTYDMTNAEEMYKNSNEAEKGNQVLIAPLPGTAIEIAKISEIMKSDNIKFESFIEDNASEKNFRSINSPYILHIATHGYFLSDVSTQAGESALGINSEKAMENPLLRSGLLLSGASNFLNFDATKTSTDNGILTAYEVANLNLQGTDLVVMSACETGLGEVMNGEGVYGLQRAFQVAGAKSIIMSLWTVDDKTTQELMVEFYTRYLGGMNKIQAFKEARLVLKEKYNSPYYWGAFKLLGAE